MQKTSDKRGRTKGNKILALLLLLFERGVILEYLLIAYIVAGLLLALHIITKATSDPIWKRLKAGLFLLIFWGPYLIKPFIEGFSVAVKKRRLKVIRGRGEMNG